MGRDQKSESGKDVGYSGYFQYFPLQIVILLSVPFPLLEALGLFESAG